jgi:hypothetical protein
MRRIDALIRRNLTTVRQIESASAAVLAGAPPIGHY